MRGKLLGIFLLLSSLAFGQYVPDTETFTLQDIVDAVSPSSNDLSECFADAVTAYFNPTYNSDLYAPANSMLRFRDYGAHNALGFETYVAPDDFDRTAQPVDIYEVFKQYYKVNHDAKYIYSVSNTTTDATLFDDVTGSYFLYSYEDGGIRYNNEISQTTVRGGWSAGNRTSIPVNDVTGFPPSGTIQFAQNPSNLFIYTSIDSTLGANAFIGESQPVSAFGSGTIVSPRITWQGTDRYVIVSNPSILVVDLWLNNSNSAEWVYCSEKINSVATCPSGYSSGVKYVHVDDLDQITEYGSYANYGSSLSGTLHISNSASSIGTSAFSWIKAGGISKVIISNSIKTIEANSFYQYIVGGTFEVIFGDSVVTISSTAFASYDGGEILYLNFPSSLVTIGDEAFKNQSSLNGKVTFPSSVTSIGNSAFLSCSKLDTLILNEGLLTIGQYAFQNCTDLDCPLTFPSTLTTIGYGAFLGCTGLNCTLTIPAGLTSIGEGAFGNTNFTAISESNTNYLVYDNVLYQLSPDTLALHSVKSATDSIEFLANTKLIGDCCCYNNLRTATLVIPDNVTRIGDYAFYNCDGFSFLNLGSASSTLVTVESSAFSYWNGIGGKTLTIPSCIITIYSHAFEYSSWASLVLNEGLVTIGDQAFGGLLQIAVANLTIPNTVKTIGGRAFFPSSFSGTLTLGDSLTSIQYDAFASCAFTGTLYIPPKVTYIAAAAFNYNKFDSIASGSPYFTVYDYVLYDETVSGQINASHSARNHSGTLTFKPGITQILNGCFISNTNRTGAIAIPNTVTSIALNSFYGCTGFTSGVIGDCTDGSSLSTIGASAFAGCSNITSWNIYDPSAATCASGSFGNYAKPLYVQTDATGYNITPATVAAPWTNTAIFSSVNYTLCP